MQVKPSDTIAHLKELMEKEINVKKENMQLFYNGFFQLGNLSTLKNCGIKDDSWVYLKYV